MVRNNRESRLQWSRNANAAKARKRMEHPVEYEPKMLPFHRFLIRVTDTITGDSHEFTMTSIRDVARRLSVVARFYQ